MHVDIIGTANVSQFVRVLVPQVKGCMNGQQKFPAY